MVAQRIQEGIFAGSLIETSWAQRSRRSWTTLTSFGLEAIAIGLALLLPLWKTVGLPSVHTLSTPVSLGRVNTAAPAPRPRSGGSDATSPTAYVLHPIMQPGRIPTGISRTSGDPASTGPIGTDMSTSDLGRGMPDGILHGSDGVMPVAAPVPVPVTRTFRVSSILEGSILRRVQPVYPPLARTARIQGSVVLYAMISKAGTIENLRAISGPPMLVPAAIDAVSQWRYRPYILNNEPVEVETQITVNFMLGGN